MQEGEDGREANFDLPGVHAIQSPIIVSTEFYRNFETNFLSSSAQEMIYVLAYVESETKWVCTTLVWGMFHLGMLHAETHCDALGFQPHAGLLKPMVHGSRAVTDGQNNPSMGIEDTNTNVLHTVSGCRYKRSFRDWVRHARGTSKGGGGGGEKGG